MDLFDAFFELSGAKAFRVFVKKLDRGFPDLVRDRLGHTARLHADCTDAHNILRPRHNFWRGTHAP